ncbi:MAG: hypothetical protein AVDCRST_MAG59-2776, partial [uncultured Thermomicrobiales bacterium]
RRTSTATTAAGTPSMRRRRWPPSARCSSARGGPGPASRSGPKRRRGTTGGRRCGLPSPVRTAAKGSTRRPSSPPAWWSRVSAPAAMPNRVGARATALPDWSFGRLPERLSPSRRRWFA